MDDVKDEVFVFVGGLNTTAPNLVGEPGTLQLSNNFEADVTGGYRRIDGYERYDGHPEPHEQEHYTLVGTLSGSYTVGDTLTGDTSGATSIIIGDTDDGYVVCKITGTYVAEDVSISGVVIGATTGTTYSGATETIQENSTYKNRVADAYRSDISPVPGGGDILGVWVYNDTLYAFRNTADNTECKMYKATTSGWSLVTTPTLGPSVRYEFINHNFGGAAGAVKMYGCDGANKAFVFDGTTFTQITTGMSPDTPSHIAAHSGHLFLSFGGSVQHSAIGDPSSWTPVLGAGEISIGDDVTSLVPQIGTQNTASLLITNRNSSYMLYGTSSSDWNLVNIQTEAGAIAYTVQQLNTAYMLDDRGIARLDMTISFGNFERGTISRNIQDWIRERRTKAVASCVVREKNQYRLFFSNGEGLYLTVDGESAWFMPVTFVRPVSCICSAEFSDGSERVFFGDADGYVNRLDVGTSFDGDAIESELLFRYNHIKSPRINKRYRRLSIDIVGDGYSNIDIGYKIGYGSADISQPDTIQKEVINSTRGWDAFTWDQFTWDATESSSYVTRMTGTGENFALNILSSSDEYKSYTVTGGVVNYSFRRRLR